MDNTVLDGTLFSKMIRGGSAHLRENRAVVNDLNVFPVPDGDTGDNMYMTAQAGYDALSAADGTLDRVAREAATGMLRGARGNSGVILSRIFAGIADGFTGVTVADAETVCRAFMQGVQKAYGAVSAPVEGTILTVYREAAEYAGKRLTQDSTLQSYFDDFTVELRRSLDRTPEILAILREAGVVDSGGAGLFYLAEGMRAALNGAEPDAAQDTEAETSNAAVSMLPEDAADYGYCTELLLQLMEKKTSKDSFSAETMMRYLNGVGESVVCFRDGDTVKIHVHTKTPGKVLDHCLGYGELLKIKIENMALQAAGATVRNRFSADGTQTAPPRKKYAVVTVAAGEGIRNTFLSIGADYVVSGGQCMNPAAADFIRAFEYVNAQTVIVLPNNGNILLTANQAADLYRDADVRVFPSRSLGEGYAALSMMDLTAGSIDAILDGMRDAVEGVVTGTVCAASRDAVIGGVAVHRGEYIGYVGDTIHAVSESRRDALLKLAAALDTSSHDVLILLCGDGIPDDEADDAYRVLERTYPKTEMIMQNGGQPVHDYILILE